MSRARDIANYGDGIDTSSITSGTLADARIPNLATSKITSGTFADARIAQSNVTQHESAIDALGTVTSGTFNGTIGTLATHGNINLKRTKSYSGVFSNGNNGDTHNILTMQDPGFYVLNYSYWRNSPGSTINGVGEVAIQYVSSNFYTTVRRSESNVSNNIDVSNTGSTLQLLYNTSEPDGSFTVYYQYIVVASHDI